MNTEWKLVPVVPDWGMLSAGGCTKHHIGQQCLHHDNRRRIWDAMLAATPAAPAVRPVAKVRGRKEPQGICYELTAQTVSLKDGEEVSLYAGPTAAEELESVLHWRNKHAIAVTQRNSLAKGVAEHFRIGLGQHEPWNVALQVLDGDFSTDSDGDREQVRLRAQLADLVTLGFKMTGASGAKRNQHTDTLVARLHELQAMLSGAGAEVTHAR